MRRVGLTGRTQDGGHRRRQMLGELSGLNLVTKMEKRARERQGPGLYEGQQLSVRDLGGTSRQRI